MSTLVKIRKALRFMTLMGVMLAFREFLSRNKEQNFILDVIKY
jgi:hypothetical protein